MRTLLSTLILSVAVNAAEVQKTNEQFVVAKGLAVRPFATQGQLSNPSSIDVDDRGRVWVAEAFNYRKKTRKAGDRILILEDSSGDGRSDKTTVFYQNPDIDGVHGVCVLGNMAIVSVSDRILLLTDTDGDDKADVKKVLFTGKVLSPVNGQHDHAIHAVMFGPDGRLYFNFGNLNAGLWRADGTLVKDVFGNPVDNSRKPYQEGMVIRCELDGSKVEVLGHNFRNNWEVTVDSFGTMWQSDNDNGSSSCRVNFVMEYGNYGYRDERTGADYHSKRTNMEATMQRRMWHQNDPGVIPNLLITGSGAPTGILVYEGDLLPEPFRGQMIHAEPGRNVVWAFPTKQVGAGYSASIVDIVRSSVGRNYRPSDVSVAPDGSLFIADWFDPVDCCHRTINDAGRIFRVAPPKHAYAVPAYDFKTPAGAAKALQSPNLSARYKAWSALIGLQESARPALETMASDDNPRFRARALWALAAIKNGTSKAIELALGDESENIRALGLRIARRHQLPVEPVVRQLVRDKSALVRRECAVSLHRLTSAESVQLWTELAAQYDGKDRWYLEALGIGEKGKETACLNAWLKKTGKDWNSRAGRDIIWRLRAPETAALLAKLLLNPSVPAAEHPRLLRALDFHDTQPKEAALIALLEGDAKHNPATYLEAFQRATPKFLEKHPEVLKRVESAMLASKGTVTFVDMVARFNRKDMVKHLMDMVQAVPEKEPGIRAARQIFAFKEGHRIAAALNKPNQATAFIKALGFVGNNQSVAMLRTVTTDEARPVPSRLLAITALGRSSSGAGALMQLVQQKKLPAKFMPPAIQSLAASPGPNTRSFAAQHLNLLAPSGKRWPIELLLAAKPDAAKGKAVFQKAGCIACHIVQGEGFDFGPELSDIGNKLSSEQLFEAILKPNQNI
ncbi:MAG: c-type cytochrome, partial [Verrucomicrobiales bacterium]|nr:c-type cytochrome [Verrucomicrobiales bacterium]